jgi:hypothetical protein
LYVLIHLFKQFEDFATPDFENMFDEQLYDRNGFLLQNGGNDDATLDFELQTQPEQPPPMQQPSTGWSPFSSASGNSSGASSGFSTPLYGPILSTPTSVYYGGPPAAGPSSQRSGNLVKYSGTGRDNSVSLTIDYNGLSFSERGFDVGEIIECRKNLPPFQITVSPSFSLLKKKTHRKKRILPPR